MAALALVFRLIPCYLIPMQKRETFLVAALLLITAVFCYANVIGGGFVWDDEYIVVQNPLVRAPLLTGAPFKQDIVNSSFATTIYYRPLQILSYALDYRLWGMRPIGFHLTNILLHFLNAFLVFLFTRRVTGNKAVALLTAVLFVTHPAHAGAVSYISGRAEVLYFFFGFCFLLFFRIYTEKKSPALLAGALFSLALAFLCKEGALIFPVLALMAGAFFGPGRKTSDFLCYIPAFVLAGVYVALHHMAFASRYQVVMGFSGSWASVERYLTMAGEFLVLGFLPMGLHMRRLAADATLLAAPVAGAVCLFAVFYLKPWRRTLLFSLGFFAVALVPFALVSGYFGVMGEHWMYLASFGLFLFISTAFVGLYTVSGKRMRFALAVALFSLVMFYSFSTSAQNRYWRSNVALSDRVLGFSQGDTAAMHFKAAAFLREGKAEEAKKAMEAYTESSPSDARSWYVKGRMVLAAGDNAAAEAAFRKAAEVDPRYGNAYFGLALVALMDNDQEAAIRLLEKAVAVNPLDAEALLMLGTVYSESGDNAKAFEYTEKAYKANPHDYRTIVNMGTVYTRMGDLKEGAGYYLKATELYPEKPVPYYNLGQVFYLGGEKKEAAKWLKKALAIEPAFKPAAELLKKISEEK
jgi:tetratricopeptide (TPR) repeat protein